MQRALRAVLLNLFYHQLQAHLICAYNSFLLSTDYDLVSHQEPEVWFKKFYQDYIWDKHSSLAWRKDWLRILFFPWTFIAPWELLVVSVSD